MRHRTARNGTGHHEPWRSQKPLGLNARVGSNPAFGTKANSNVAGDSTPATLLASTTARLGAGSCALRSAVVRAQNRPPAPGRGRRS